MACGALTEYDGILPNNTTQTPIEAAQNCKDFRDWQINTFVPEFTALIPTICAAANIADLSQYKGEWGSTDTPTAINKGESVSVGDTFYVSKIDGNTDTPPSANWATREAGYGKTEIDNMVFGMNTTRYDETTNRALGVTYTNPSSTKPMKVLVFFNITGTTTKYQSVNITTGDGVVIEHLGVGSDAQPDNIAEFWVMPGETYLVESGYNSPGLRKWIEIR